MKATKFILGVVTLLLVTSCKKDAQQSTKINNSEFEVEFLFEHDGCKVYRFSDNGHLVYFSKCVGATNSGVSYDTGGKGNRRVINETSYQNFIDSVGAENVNYVYYDEDLDLESLDSNTVIMFEGKP